MESHSHLSKDATSELASEIIEKNLSGNVTSECGVRGNVASGGGVRGECGVRGG